MVLNTNVFKKMKGESYAEISKHCQRLPDERPRASSRFERTNG